MGRKALTVDWRAGMVTSRDGTGVSFLSVGRGPGLVVIPGNNRRAHHYEALARELSGTHSVHVIDRRGRGLSGPQGPDYRLDSEVDDAVAVVERTRSETIFGHSYGGLVGLHLALRRSVAALVVYEPGVSIGGSFEGGWLPAFTRLLDEGRHNAAMATFLKYTRLAPIGDAPMLVFRALAYLLLHGSDGRDTRAMMATTPAEVGEVIRLDSDGSRYAQIRSPTLLLGGSKTPTYITAVLPELARIIPTARCMILDGLDHNAPDLNAPVVIAGQIRTFRPADVSE
jgi:pimeloyl-ACP methyl ester carboxylesterase